LPWRVAIGARTVIAIPTDRCSSSKSRNRAWPSTASTRAAARAGLADYWILNLVDRVLEIYRQPVADAAAPFGWRYATREVRGAESSVELPAVPGARIRVSDLLP
jgi:hypothetical protein